MWADLHCHSHRSDGVEAPADLVRAAAAAGLRCLALTDHDSLDGIDEARRAASALGGTIELVAGVELSCAVGEGEVHLLGLFVDPADAELARVLADARETRQRRGEAMVERLVAAGLDLDAEAIRRRVAGGAFGRPHVARELVAAGFAADVDDAFAKWLVRGRPGYVPKPRLDARRAIDLVHGAAGVVSVAHPVWYRDPDGTVAALADMGVDAVEASHPDQDEETEARLRALAGRLGLAESAGSDYHEPGRGRTVGQCRLGKSELDRLRGRAGGAR